jgi:hypothetical protein
VNFQVVRSGWGDARVVVALHPTRRDANADRRAWEHQAIQDFKEGRITYDVPSFHVEHVVTR